MKKLIWVFPLLLIANFIFAQQSAIVTIIPAKEPVMVPAKATPEPVVPILSTKQQRKIYKERNKKILKLTKQYHKASEAQKPVIKAELAAIISQAMDDGIARSKQHIADSRTNLDKWEANIKTQEATLDQVKAKRVDDILSGEAERKHELAQKRWKAEIKAMQSRLK